MVSLLSDNLSSVITIINELARHGTKIFSSAWLKMTHYQESLNNDDSGCRTEGKAL
jgi:hypothetical protein